MQAITTRFYGPTNTRGSRIVAKCDAGKLSVSWDHGKGIDENHDAAAAQLAAKLGWDTDDYGRLVGGGLPGGNGNCYVFVKGAK